MPEQPADAAANVVRIDRSGAVQPVGPQASAALRKRAGMMELVASPPALLLLRQSGPKRPWFAGELGRAGALWDLIGMLGQGGWTGELTVIDAAGAERSIFIESGAVVGANSNAQRERLGEVLYHYGALAAEQIDMVLGAVTPEVRFGEAAVALGFITREKLFEMISRQTEEIVYSVMRVETGSFCFLEGIDERRLSNRLNFNISSLMMEGAQRMDEMSLLRQRIPSGEHIPSQAPNARSKPDPELMPVFQAVDGVSSIDDIGRLLGLGQFDVMRVVFQLMQKNQVTLRAPRPTGPAAVVEQFNLVMSLILRKVDEVGGGRDVREQLASFASASGVYDALFRQAGPNKDGTVHPERVVENIGELVTPPEAAEQMLNQWLHEYGAFAMFIAEPLLRAKRATAGGPTDAAQVAKQVADLLRPLSGG